MNTHFDDAARDALYRVIAARRDMRHFVPGTVEPAVLQRVLQAAHRGPSVGLMQPWHFIRITDAALRRDIAGQVEAERQATALALGERGADFLRLKVEGVRECAELLAAVLAPDDGTVLGRRTLPQEMALCSLACAIENLWLASRAENLGLGWVSLFDPEALGPLLRLPPGARPMALLCLGPVARFYDEPMLQAEGWRKARPLDDFLHTNHWPQD